MALLEKNGIVSAIRPFYIADVEVVNAAGSVVGGTITGQDIGNTIYVASLTDLPAAVGGLRTLLPGVIYHLLGSIDIGTDRIVMGTTGRIALTGETGTSITTANALPMITATTSITFRGIEIINTAGPAFTFTPTGTFDIFSVHNSQFRGVGAHTFVGLGSNTCFVHVAALVLSTEGLVFSGGWGTIALQAFGWSNGLGTGTAITLDSSVTVDQVSINGCQLITNAAETGLDIDVAVSPTATGSVHSSFFLGAGLATAVGGIDQTSADWQFTSNAGIEDSVVLGQIEYEGNAAETVISTISTATAITHTPIYVLNPLSERVELSGTDNLRYTGKEDMRITVNVNAQIEGVANNKSLRIHLFNGIVELDSFAVDYRQTPVNASHLFLVALSQSDDLDVRVSNDSDTTNIIVNSMTLGMH